MSDIPVFVINNSSQGGKIKIILIGAEGAVGKNVYQALKSGGHEIVKVGRKRGDLQVNIEDPESLRGLYKKLAPFDAVANASGDVGSASHGHQT